MVRHVHVRQPRESGAAPGEAQGPLTRAVEVVRTYLELRSPDQLRAADTAASVEFAPRPSITVDVYRRLYASVGYRWYWRDRNVWSDEQLAAHLARPEISVWE